MNDGSCQGFALVSTITGQNIEIIYCAEAEALVPPFKTVISSKTGDVVYMTSL